MSRAIDVLGLRKKMTKLSTKEGLKQGLSMVSRETDIFISPFSKCGTTWLQQILHTLRTHGDMDFDDISRVVPWVEVSTDLGIDLTLPQKAQPRLFKSHLPYDRIPKPGKYVVSLRDPGDALVSAFHFMQGWLFEAGSISIEEFARQTFLEDPALRYFHHFRSWWSVRNQANVLLIFFEEMKEDPEGHIRRLSNFIDIPLTQGLLDVTLEHSSLKFMKTHLDKFDDRLMKDKSEKEAGIPPGSDSAKVREGKVGSHHVELSTHIKKAISDLWVQELSELTGYSSYSSLRTSHSL